MVVKLQKYDAVRALDPGRLFCDDIEDDPWVAYHGTSDFNALGIEKDGFTTNCIIKNALAHVARIYESMGYFGESSGSYGVLRPFSLDHDLADESESLIFFAESSLRAMLYATREFAGGEKMYAVRNAFRELQSYLDDASVRERHQAAMNRDYQWLLSRNAHPTQLEKAKPKAPNLEWLADQLAEIGEFCRAANDLVDRHRQGVVYAIKFGEGDLKAMEWHSSMGIECRRPIPASKIVGKVDVPLDANLRNTAYFGHDRNAHRGSGLLQALLANERKPGIN